MRVSVCFPERCITKKVLSAIKGHAGVLRLLDDCAEVTFKERESADAFSRILTEEVTPYDMQVMANDFLPMTLKKSRPITGHSKECYCMTTFDENESRMAEVGLVPVTLLVDALQASNSPIDIVNAVASIISSHSFAKTDFPPIEFF